MDLERWTKLIGVASLIVLTIVALVTFTSIIFGNGQNACPVSDEYSSSQSPDKYHAEICTVDASNGEINYYSSERITPKDFKYLGVCFESEEEHHRPLVIYWHYEDQHNALMKSQSYCFSSAELVFISMYDAAQIPENVFDYQEDLSTGSLIPGNYTATVRHGRNNLAILTFEVGE